MNIQSGRARRAGTAIPSQLFIANEFRPATDGATLDTIDPSTEAVITAVARGREVEAGSVGINGWVIGGVQAPIGGIKESRIGRERGLPGIRNYLAIKNVGIRL